MSQAVAQWSEDNSMNVCDVAAGLIDDKHTADDAQSAGDLLRGGRWWRHDLAVAGPVPAPRPRVPQARALGWRADSPWCGRACPTVAQ